MTMALIQNNATEKTSFLDFQVSQSVKTGGGAEFEKVMQTTKDTPTSNKQLSQKTDVHDVAKKTDGTETLKEKLASVNSKAQDKVAAPEAEINPKEVVEVISTLIQNIKELLLDTFQISGEELAGIMEEMGMTDLDLLNPDFMNQLTIQLSGTENPMDLLFQPDLMESLKNLNMAVENLKAETFAPLHLSEEEVQGILETLHNSQDVPVEEIPVVQKEQPVLQEEPKVPEARVETGQQAEPVVVKTEQLEGEQADTGAEDKTDGQQQMHQAINPVMENLKQAVEEVLPEADAENVVKQVVEQIRVSVKADTSSFEMQLNPEHLGKINLQVAAKNGVVTAQIATENEAVKEALESQIAALKESLNNQGIKVEAVEVTIASHEFERSLDDQREQGQQQENQKKRFRFDVMEAAEEELTPADAVMRDIMLANGNQMNMMA